MGLPADRLARRANHPQAVSELREVAGRVAPVALTRDQLLAVPRAIAPLFPQGGLRRGSVVGITSRSSGTGATCLALAVLAGVSGAGSWTAMVGLPALGALAAAEQGVDLARFALIPDPGTSWPSVAAALLDAIDVVVVATVARLRPVRPADARRLVARARERGTVLVVLGPWPEGPDVRLRVSGASWSGLGQGHGLLSFRSLEVEADGRGVAARPRLVRVELARRSSQ